MTTASIHTGPVKVPTEQTEPPRLGRFRGRRWLGLLVGLVILVTSLLLSVAVGARAIPPDTVWQLLWHPDGSELSVTIHDLRIPRTLLGLLVGVGLGLAGVLMQALTRNPLADPGLFGVNAGAAFAVVCSVVFLGLTEPSQYLWFALLGAGLTAAVVYVLGGGGRPSSHTRLALAGFAVAAALHAVTHGFTTMNATAYDEIRFWLVGTFAGRSAEVVAGVAPLIVVGAVLALFLGRSLNALALGDDSGRALGARPGRTRAIGTVAVLLLCGAATAGAGPISFLGLAVPHMVRLVTGPDHRWLLAYSAVYAPALLLLADVLGRVIAFPGEVPVGIVMAFLGAPIFIVLLRRRHTMTH
ncbi:iron chelate uptake ABC transporter family permease subunit [Micromonospora sonneratiae]|uniref:FecCD family ABC transporter permease n=1 Tax=Micromonospora sonneratiae TaxID=1184706 RepID=A0ABW3YL21_9ACTN